MSIQNILRGEKAHRGFNKNKWFPQGLRVTDAVGNVSQDLLAREMHDLSYIQSVWNYSYVFHSLIISIHIGMKG